MLPKIIGAILLTIVILMVTDIGLMVISNETKWFSWFAKALLVIAIAFAITLIASVWVLTFCK